MTSPPLRQKLVVVGGLAAAGTTTLASAELKLKMIDDEISAMQRKLESGATLNSNSRGGCRTCSSSRPRKATS